MRLEVIRPSNRLAPFVAAIWAWDVDEKTACSMSGKLLPSVAPQFAFHFGAPMLCDRGSSREPYLQIVAGLQTEVVTVRATGHVRAIMVRLKPEAAPRLISSPLCELRDAHVELSDLFPRYPIATLPERLADASDTAARAIIVEELLLGMLRDRIEDAHMLRAAAILRHNCDVQVREVAAALAMSERHLLRRFRAVYGVGPKQFARIARLTRALDVGRRPDSNWAQVAAECSFTDQAHLIKDFRTLTRQAPGGLLRGASAGDLQHLNRSLRNLPLTNTFLVR